MTTYDAGEFTLEKVRDYVWELPQSGEMRVPARVLASEALLEEIKEDKTLEQLRNTTHLPGIHKHALCMPDGHQGYGFPVGGVAALDAENGCISPGAVGYDINCLAGDTSVRLSHGRHIDIAALESCFESESALVAAADGLAESPIQLFTASGSAPVYDVETASGQRITATGDHPFRTPEGMCNLDSLEPGDEVLVEPFEGIEHDQPDDVTLLTVEDFSDDPPQLRRVLEDRDILPLSTTDDILNRLLKVLGFVTGDGAFGCDGQTRFYGVPSDLEQIRTDIDAIGFTPSRGAARDRAVNGERFDATETGFTCTATAFRRLLEELGAPVGPTVEAGFSTPWYFEHLTDWQRALYYRAYFGAEMTAPTALHETNLACPTVSEPRTVETAPAGRAWLDDMATFLDDLGIETTDIEEFETASTAGASKRRLRLGVKNDSQNLLRFFSTVGYTYNRSKQRRAVKAIQYLRRTEREIDRHVAIADDPTPMADGGTTLRAASDSFDSTERAIERRRWAGHRERPGSGAEVPGFEAFCETCSVDESLSVVTEIAAIEPAGEQPVYDIGVEHDAHNFLANGFVVSNCGVRMVKTDLTYDDLRGREEELVDQLFANVPSGLGGGGVYEGSKDDMDAILSRGMDWALEQGYAVADDLEHCEDEGFRPEADPAKVSQKAKDRGKNQVGSLGSGNHFLEVQRVTDVYREDVAADFGLGEDQVVVLIHCGSRGLGHQVCTDYLRDIEQTHAGLLEQLPDKELAAAPAGSQLAEDYYQAMCAAINFAWVNRQLVMHQTRKVFEKVFDRDWEALGLYLLYDVAHNIAKRETHDVGDGRDAEVFVHRKGATRAFPAGHPDVPAAYRDVGQPIIIPGSMGAGSYVLRGGDHSLAETFGSTAHGAGRLMSRTQAKNEYWGEDVMDDLRDQQHVYVKAQSGATVAEEAPGVYKDVDEVVRVSDALGIGDRVARTFPVCNIKG